MQFRFTDTSPLVDTQTNESQQMVPAFSSALAPMAGYSTLQDNPKVQQLKTEKPTPSGRGCYATLSLFQSLRWLVLSHTSHTTLSRVSVQKLQHFGFKI